MESSCRQQEPSVLKRAGDNQKKILIKKKIATYSNSGTTHCVFVKKKSITPLLHGTVFLTVYVMPRSLTGCSSSGFSLTALDSWHIKYL